MFDSQSSRLRHKISLSSPFLLQFNSSFDISIVTLAISEVMVLYLFVYIILSLPVISTKGETALLKIMPSFIINVAEEIIQQQ